MSASHHLSFVVSIDIAASSMQRHASSTWPSSEYALAKYDKCNGIQTVDPVDRHVAIPEVIIWTASAGLPVRPHSQPRPNIAPALHRAVSFSSASATSSSSAAFAVV